MLVNWLLICKINNSLFLLSLQIKYDGLTGQVEFDNQGLRSNITVDILELGEVDLKLIGTWNYGVNDPADRFKTVRETASTVFLNDRSIKNKTLRVITALVITTKQTHL